MTRKNDSMLEDFFNSISPEYSFDETRIPEEPDYSQDHYWAALPTINSVANLFPKELGKEDVQKEVDCFFIHPTGFFLKDWNFNILKESLKKVSNMEKELFLF